MPGNSNVVQSRIPCSSLPCRPVHNFSDNQKRRTRILSTRSGPLGPATPALAIRTGQIRLKGWEQRPQTRCRSVYLHAENMAVTRSDPTCGPTTLCTHAVAAPTGHFQFLPATLRPTAFFRAVHMKQKGGQWIDKLSTQSRDGCAVSCGECHDSLIFPLHACPNT